jgi:hypothetical protein
MAAMNASPEIAPENGQLAAEYERLKPLRDLEKLLMKEKPRPWTLAAAMGSTGALVALASGAMNFSATWGFLVTMIMIAVALTWVSYAKDASRERWVMAVTMLRTLAHDINELRAEKR